MKGSLRNTVSESSAGVIIGHSEGVAWPDGKATFTPTHKQLQEAGIDVVHPPYLDHPKNWPYTLHDVDESPFNLRHGYMWGKFSGFSE